MTCERCNSKTVARYGGELVCLSCGFVPGSQPVPLPTKSELTADIYAEAALLKRIAYEYQGSTA
jgi:transcription initiation factor TFIIIB Brf1 subunit/transcription initiation factor TFIIB